MAISLDKVKPNVVTSNLTDKIWLWYGEQGTRKTSVACSFPKHILFAFDIGYKLINGAMAVPMQSWTDFKSTIKQLDQQKHRDSFSIVVIDTIGMAYQACYQYMLTQMGVEDPGQAGAFGIGWKKIRNEFEMVVRSIVQKGYGLIMLAHSDEVEKEDKITKKKIATVKIDIDKRPDLIIKGLADFVFYLNKEQPEGYLTPTVVAYSKLIEVETKSRSRYFTDRFEFNYDNLQKELEKAIEKQYKEEGLVRPESVEQTNPYAKEKIDFEQLLQEVKTIATLLVEKGFEEKVSNTLLNVFKGTKLSELTDSEDNIEKLTVVNATLIELKDKAKV